MHPPGGLLILSLGTGWWLSGRALRPVRQITATAQDISATDLSRRIALDGPRDELKTLADTVDDMLGRLESAFVSQRQLVDDASHMIVVIDQRGRVSVRTDERCVA